MPQRAEKADTARDRTTLPPGVVLGPPASIEDLKADTENGPEGAEEFASLIQALREQPKR
jgi:hypothetical protein